MDMNVKIEVWPVAADEHGLWLCSGVEAWQPDLPLSADADVHAEVELTIATNGAERAAVPMIHSTSWRPRTGSIILTYVAVVAAAGPVRLDWPDAVPLSPLLPAAVGRPLTHAAQDAPTPRDVDVLLHALRHLAFLIERDADAAAVLRAQGWEPHLARFAPALAGMYDERHAEAA